MTEVVAALIREGGKFMICQRPAHKARGLEYTDMRCIAPEYWG